jgi:hypothetical protein
MTAMKQYRVNADSWTRLMDILVGYPEDFNYDSASFRGRRIEKGGYIPENRLDGDARKAFYSSLNEDRIEYIIFSYNTPIAWLEYTDTKTANRRWVMPMEKDTKGNERPVRYSVTTSKHQGKVATALSQINGGI